MQRAAKLKTDPKLRSSEPSVYTPRPSYDAHVSNEPAPNPYGSGGTPVNSTPYSGGGTGYTDNVYAGAGAYAKTPDTSAPCVPVSRKEFFDTYLSEKLRKGFKTNTVIAYICVILSVVVNVFMYTMLPEEYPITALMGAMVEIAIMFGYVLGIHTAKNKVCAVGLVALTAADSLYALIVSQKMTGFLFLAAAVSLLKVITDGEKEYKAFVENAGMPYNKNSNAGGIFGVIAVAAAFLLLALAA